jgi:hypothetical protein
MTSARVIDEPPRIAGAKACLSFSRNNRSRKTKTGSWEVWDLTDARHIGQVRWYSRTYCFFPASGIALDQDRLRSIAELVESETEKHRKGKRSF